MELAQPAILAEETSLARYITFAITDAENIPSVLQKLADTVDITKHAIGIGQNVIQSLDTEIPGLRYMPALAAGEIEVPTTADDLWIWLRGDDRGKLFHLSLALEEICHPAFELTSAIDSFQYDKNRDLSGYEDGTENPEGDDAVNAAIVKNDIDGLNGSSFVAVQQWIHDFEILDEMSTEEKDDAIGRHISNNEEYDAPKSAHVKRSAQEDFEPEAFMLRRSMPWAVGMDGGLMFVAFGHSFDAFEAIMERMMGEDDGILDAIFKFTVPITGAYFWCPPVKGGKLDLTALNLG
ncbi:Dyp-type peroxidase [Pseudemcibacter aquimaris]|uniref:Dyp-type peroxidase n=1 Tax=Pseudemcibacter aquimaris TaxID=2857064 RepID=UPI002011AAB3|nr:Dyp-type peroxidase [Pseudemcibacter aquimaris]MCC3859963.1 Dyp-type peroxidase [Pseudemcibacter aquimaris]WDU57295.1 Dyp-type peroxidase [Pseudemcibacter aquimaris]